MQPHRHQVGLLQLLALFAILATVNAHIMAQPSSLFAEAMSVGVNSENKTPMSTAPTNPIFMFWLSNSLTDDSTPTTPAPLELADQQQQLNNSEFDQLFFVMELSANHSMQSTTLPPPTANLNLLPGVQTDSSFAIASSTPTSTNASAVDEPASNTTVGTTTSSPLEFTSTSTPASATARTTKPDTNGNGTVEALLESVAQVQGLSDSELFAILLAGSDHAETRPANYNQAQQQQASEAFVNTTENSFYPKASASAFPAIVHEENKENVSSITGPRAITTLPLAEEIKTATFKPTTSPTTISVATAQQTGTVLQPIGSIRRIVVSASGQRQPEPTLPQSQVINHDFHPILANVVLGHDFEAHSSNSVGTGNGPAWRRLFSFSNLNSKRKRLESSSSSGSGRSRSSAASFLSSRSRRVEKTWFPINITESLTNEAWPRNEASLIFEVGADSLKNVNRAELTVIVNQPTAGRLMPYVLYGKYEALNASSKAPKTLNESATTLLDVVTLPNQQDRLSFGVTTFIQNIVGNFSKISTFRLSYFVRRQADFDGNNMLLVVQPSATNYYPILSESSFDPPYFKVHYVQ